MAKPKPLKGAYSALQSSGVMDDVSVDKIDMNALDAVFDASNQAKKQLGARNEVDTEDMGTRKGAQASNKDVWISPDGVQVPLGKVAVIDMNWVSGVFEGNGRTVVTNLDELVGLIIQAGKNSQPVKLRPADDGSLKVVTGQRRTLAIQKARTLTDKEITYWGVIEHMEDDEAVVEAVMENLGREDLNIWDRAVQLEKLLQMGVAKKIEDLIPFLPLKNGKPVKRTAVHFYLLPARLPLRLMDLINKELPASTQDVRRLDALLKNVSEYEVSRIVDQSLASGVLKHSKTPRQVYDILMGALKVEGDSSEQFEISGHDGVLATVKLSAKGGGVLKLDKKVSPDKIDQIMKYVEQLLKADS